MFFDIVLNIKYPHHPFKTFLVLKGAAFRARQATDEHLADILQNIAKNLLKKVYSQSTALLPRTKYR